MSQTWSHGNSQNPHPKNANQAVLLPLRQTQAIEDRDREHDDDEVGDDVHGRVAEPVGHLVQAAAFDCLVPEKGNGPAHEDGAEKGPGAVDADDGAGDEDGAPGGVRREDAQVLEEHGDFGDGGAEVVDWDGDVEGLVMKGSASTGVGSGGRSLATLRIVYTRLAGVFCSAGPCHSELL